MKGRTSLVTSIWFNLALSTVIWSTMVMAVPHVAHISMNGLRAMIEFNTGESSVEINVTLGCESCVSDSDQFTWNVHQNPMLYDREEPCSSNYVGSVFMTGSGNLADTHGNLTGAQLNAGSVTFTDNSINFQGQTSLSGRAIVFEKVSDTTQRYCASIRPVEAVRTAVATFQYPVAGTVVFRQLMGENDAADTSIYVDLDVTAAPLQSRNLTWQIKSNGGVTFDMTLDQQCQSVNDENIYDLTSEFGYLNVETISNHVFYYFIDPNLSLEGENSVLDMSLVLSDITGTSVACPTIRELTPKTIYSYVSSKNISGTVTFSQRSPWDHTTIRVDLQNLQSLIGGYHVHEYPIPPRYFESDNLADVNSVAGHFNPYGITDFPDPTVGTEDQYEIGDISNKFGYLTDLDSINESYTDWNMPLFGTNSIVGRSIVLHLNSDGSRYAYGQIGYPSLVKTVIVDFKAPVTGSIIMRQDANDPLADASVFVDIANVDGTSTVDHNWHVHIQKIDNDYLADEGRCLANEGHYNPFNVDLDNNYSECSPSNPRRCEAGDFSGKHGQLDISATLHTSDGKFFFTDIQLPLSGVYSIDERSVVIHDKDSGAGRLACHDTFEVLSKTVSTTIWTDTTVSGSIVFEQNGLHDPPEISVDIRGLANLANGWHVHVLPVPYEENEDGVCSLTLGHFNPFNIVGSPAVATLDLYEVGDLSGKFETLEDRTSFQDVFTDQTMTLRGPRSIDGRSIVVHRDDETGSRWSCTTLEKVLDDESFGVEASATFDQDAVAGSITFRQTHQGNDYLGDTTIDSALDLPDNSVSNWSVLDTTEVSECNLSSEVYDPFNVQDDTAQCSLARQGQCIVGNLGGKHDSIPDGGALFTDTNLPLIGQTPIIGRVLRLKIGDDIYCSQIQPLKEQGVEMTLSFPATVDFDPYDFRLALSESVENLEMWQIVVSSDSYPSPSNSECQTIAFWVIGSNVEDLEGDITEATDLGDFSPMECSDLEATSPSPDHASTTRIHPFVFSLSFVILLLFSFM